LAPVSRGKGNLQISPTLKKNNKHIAGGVTPPDDAVNDAAGVAQSVMSPDNCHPKLFSPFCLIDFRSLFPIDDGSTSERERRALCPASRWYQIYIYFLI
jgi:hypothetical protein